MTTSLRETPDEKSGLPAPPSVSVVAVTGTDGKTSTVEFTRQLRTQLGHPTASWGSLGLITPDDRFPDPPLGVGADGLASLLESLRWDGIDVLTIEAFSSSLDRGLLDSLPITVAGFTNLRHDHLDYHGSTEAYFDAKSHLFRSLLAPDGVSVINADSSKAARLRAIAADRDHRLITYGRAPDADVRLLACEPSGTGTRVHLTVCGDERTAEVPFVGEMMVENLLCAVGLTLALGAPVDEIRTALPALTPPPGRVEHVTTYNGADIYVDYAHTPGALAALLRSLRGHTRNRLHLVFGCGGDRDRAKRSRMGQIAARFADVVVVTDDNPRSENPAAIRRAILTGCPAAVEVPGRREAIDAAVAQLAPGDSLVIAGKGHETTQEIGDERRPFSDQAIVAETAAKSNQPSPQPRPNSR